MLIYNIVLVLTLFGLLLTLHNRDKQLNVLYFLLCFIIIMTSCLHGEEVGYDTHTYMDFYKYPEKHDISPFEFILPSLIYLLRGIYPHPYFINFCILLIAQIPIFKLINKYSQNRFYSIFLYLSFSVGVSMFLVFMAAVRQALALGFFALAVYEYLNSNEKINIRVIIPLLLMIFSHNSSFLVIPLFILSKIKINKYNYYLATAIACIGGFAIDKFLGSLLNIAVSMDKEFYFSKEFLDASILTAIPFVLPFLFIVYILPKDRLQTIWVKGMFLMALTTGFLYPIAYNLERICAYYYLMTIFAIPETISVKYNNTKKISILFFTFIIIAYFTHKYYTVLDILSDSDYPYVPYKTFF